MFTILSLLGCWSGTRGLLAFIVQTLSETIWTKKQKNLSIFTRFILKLNNENGGTYLDNVSGLPGTGSTCK